MKCALCFALTQDGQTDFNNKIIRESKNFALIPSIGPLCKGHILLITKKHTEQLAGVSQPELEEFEMFLNEILNAKSDLKNILVVEHGSFNGQKGGACVEHTHVHLIPGYEQHFNILDETLNEIKEIRSIGKLKKADFPYILSFNRNGGFRIYEAYNVHSQMMRKAICSKIGIKEWDWRKNHNESLIKSSINFWAN